MIGRRLRPIGGGLSDSNPERWACGRWFIRVVALALVGRGAPCAPIPAPGFSSARRHDGSQADLLLRQVLRRALRVPVSSACGGPRWEVRPGGRGSGPLRGLRSVWAATHCVALRGSQELGSHSMGGQRLGREFTVANRTGWDRPGGEVPGNALDAIIECLKGNGSRCSNSGLQ